MANIPSYEEMQKLIKEFTVPILEKLEQLNREEERKLDIYTNRRIIDELGGYISNDTLTRLREKGELPGTKKQGKWYYKGEDVRRVFTQSKNHSNRK